MYSRIVVLLILLSVIIVSGCIQQNSLVENQSSNISNNSTIHNYSEQTKDLCEAGGAKWKLFNSGCHDECYVKRATKPVACNMALSYGCDCPENQCWNGSYCEPI
ncbi:MAG: hypothetical protein HY831_03520 [Candidatus Aenigmarchaeota archaeon]|nr:hypothetical protein [Candidatus Aenigmarchaeota archaeon]